MAYKGVGVFGGQKTATFGNNFILRRIKRKMKTGASSTSNHIVHERSNSDHCCLVQWYEEQNLHTDLVSDCNLRYSFMVDRTDIVYEKSFICLLCHIRSMVGGKDNHNLYNGPNTWSNRAEGKQNAVDLHGEERKPKTMLL